MTTSADEAAIVCIGLTKAYDGSGIALNNLTLTIPYGRAFGLLGENGAGKSTLVRLLMGFIFPTAGRVRVLGEEQVERAHPRIGYIHERALFETRFTGRAYLTYFGQLSGLWGPANRARVAAVLAQVHLEEAANQHVGTYSKGMLQRLAIAQALLTDPELLIMDEPTSALDPRAQWEVRQIIAALRQQGKTILLCSHYLAEVESLCDAVAILRRGQLVLTGPVGDLVQRQDAVEIALANNQSASEVAAQLSIGGPGIETEQNLLRIPARAQSAILATLVAAGISIRSLNPITQTLEDVYVRVTRPTDGPPDAPFPQESDETTSTTGGRGGKR